MWVFELSFTIKSFKNVICIYVSYTGLFSWKFLCVFESLYYEKTSLWLFDDLAFCHFKGAVICSGEGAKIQTNEAFWYTKHILAKNKLNIMFMSWHKAYCLFHASLQRFNMFHYTSYSWKGLLNNLLLITVLRKASLPSFSLFSAKRFSKFENASLFRIILSLWLLITALWKWQNSKSKADPPLALRMGVNFDLKPTNPSFHLH